MRDEVWKYITFILVLVLGVFVTSTALLYLQNQSIEHYTPAPVNSTCTSNATGSFSNLALQARVQELEAQLRAVEMERNITPSNEVIAVVPIFGLIDDGTALNVVPTLMRLASNDSIGGVLLWIESPGGDVGAVRDIYHAVLTLKSKKPVVAYTGGEAASGGYYIAVGADRIVADPLADVGSIGVLYVHYDYSQNYASNGIKVTVFKTGPHKDMGAEWRALTPEERREIQNMINVYFRSFIDAVSYGRNMTRNETMKYATGETWFASNLTGTLVDETGNFQTAIGELEKLMNVSSARIKLYEYPTEGYSLGSIGSTALYLDPRYMRLLPGGG